MNKSRCVRTREWTERFSFFIITALFTCFLLSEEPPAPTHLDLIYSSENNSTYGKIINGKYEGELVTVRDGVKEFVLFFKNGIVHGAYIHYHPNGKVHLSGFQANGKAIGNWYVFSDDEKLTDVQAHHMPEGFGVERLRTMPGFDQVPKVVLEQKGKPNIVGQAR